MFFSFVAKEKFVSYDVLTIILQNASIVGIIMPFYTIAMISGQVDFSTTQVGALAGTLFALLVTIFKWPWWDSLIHRLSSFSHGGSAQQLRDY